MSGCHFTCQFIISFKVDDQQCINQFDASYGFYFKVTVPKQGILQQHYNSIGIRLYNNSLTIYISSLHLIINSSFFHSFYSYF
jgi:hypothetical protein